MAPSLGRGRVAATLAVCLTLAACSGGSAHPGASPATLSPGASASPSVSPLAPGVMPPRLVGADDATLLNAAEHPRTGEVWLTEAHDLEPTVPIVAAGQTEYFAIHVGTRGDAEIFLVVEPGRAGYHAEPVSETYDSGAFVEVRGDKAYIIWCPLPTQDACPTPSWSGSEAFDSSVEADGTVFYDSLAAPGLVEIEGIPVEGPAMLWDDGSLAQGNLGDPMTLVAAAPSNLLVRDVVVPTTTLATFGGWTLVSYESPMDNGLPTYPLRWISPLGTTYRTGVGDRSGEPSPQTIEWADGVEPLLPTGYDACFSYVGVRTAHCDYPFGLTVDDVHEDSQWTIGGSLSSGTPVYVPIAGGNDWSRSLWAEYGIPSGENQGNPDYFASEADFLAGRGVIEIQGFDGNWWILVSANPEDLWTSCD